MNAQTAHNRWLWLAPLALAFALLGILLVLLPARPALAQGSTCIVTTTDNSGPGTLRQCVADVDSGGVITFTLTTPNVITLTSGEIVIDKALTIDGPGAELIAVSGNNASRIFTATSTLTIDGLTLRDGNASGSGGAIHTTAPLTLTAVAVISNTAVVHGGAIYNDGDSLTLTNADISGNFAENSGGSIYNNGGSLTLTNARISGNTANISNGGTGGAIRNSDGSATLTNILISGNKASNGGAIYNINSSLQLTNVTLSGNLAPYNPGGAIANLNGNIQLVNGVVWGNGTSGPPGAQIGNYSGATVLSYTLIQSGTNDIWASSGSVTFGPGVITSNPLFVAPVAVTDAPTSTGNYRLLASSPAIDAGDNSAINLPTDLDGSARVQGAAVDMGAYEATPSPDVTIAKTVAPAFARPGEAITYTLRFTNSGTAIATDVVVTDSVPFSVTNPSVAGSSGAVITPTGTAPNFAWQVADLAPKDGGIITLTGVLSNPLPAGVFTNTAEITATGDGDPANNSSSAAILVPSSNADLASLELSNGSLTPAFISTTTSYTAAVENLTTSVTLTPTTSDANATLAVNGAPLGSGDPFTLTSLVVGPNVVSTTVTAEDGVTQQSYAITVTRLGADGDWYVDPIGDDGNNCRAPGVGYACRTIIGAMNKAASGDRIFIAPATYTESLVVTKSLTYIGVGGADVTFVSGGGSSRVISVTSGVDVTLDGLSITGGRLSGATPATGAGAGIYNSGNLTLTTTVITNNLATSASTGTGGGGIYNAAPGVLRLFDSSVISNSGFYGGGLFVAGGAATLDHSTVLSNAVPGAQALGAGIYVNGASTVVTATNATTIAGNRNVVVSNNNNNGGGAYIAAGALKVISSTIASNVAGNSGGGVVVYPGARAELVASTVFSNATGAASNHNGGGIYSLGTVTLTDSTVASNRAGGRGAGIYQFGNGLTIVGSTIASNATGSSTDGGGVYLDASAATQATISNSVVASNTANSGAGIYAVSFVTLTMTGGSIYNNTSNAAGGGVDVEGTLALTDVSVYGNRANGGRGGGVYAGGAATLTGGTIRQNTSARGGGGLYAAQTVSLTNVDVLSNTTTNDGPSNIGYGGGLYATGSATLTGGRFQNNQCTHETCGGGGVYTVDQLSATDTIFRENSAGKYGGALNLAGIATLTGVQIISNTATVDTFGSGGGVNATAALTLTNATVLSNTSNSEGGGVIVAAPATVIGGSYQGNRATSIYGSGGAIFVYNGSLTLRDAAVSNNWAGANGGGVSVIGAATLSGATLADNTANGSQGGGLNVSAALVMTDVQVLRNTSTSSGGGVYADDTVAVTGGSFQNNACTAAGCIGGGLYAYLQANVNAARFSGNTATGSGGALYLNNQGRREQRIVNTLLDGNSAPQGAGLYDSRGGTTILFTTVASPTVGAGSAVYVAAGTVAITDTVVASYTTGIDAGSGALAGDYNLFYNAPTTLVTGTHSLTADPRFRAPAAGNYRLLAASPAVGAGVNVSVTVDLDGAPRPQGSGYDLGAYQVNTVWYVDPAGDDGNTCFFPGAANACRTIGGALGKAQIGSTIYITTGVYPENLNVTVPIRFIGTGANTAAVVVDGSSSGSVFDVTASDVTFSGMTFQNGAADLGAGIRASGNLSMTDVAVLTNTAFIHGGGIFAASALTLTNVAVRGNTAVQDGGGIYASSAPSLTNVSVLGNTASQSGGGLYLHKASTLSGGLYQGNEAAAGGAIYAAGALTLTDSSIVSNVAGWGGGVYGMGSLSVESASVLSNTATESGGGVYTPAGATVTGGLFQANVAANTAAIDEGGGGGLYALAPVTMVDAQFVGNSVSGQGSGGGAYIYATLTLTNVQFLTNTVALTSTAGGGGAYAAGDITASGGRFQANDCAGDGCFGGALFATGALTMTGVEVRDNRASGSGGGVLVAGVALIDGGTFQGNRSVDGVGGAIDALDLLTLDSVAVLSNTALSGGGAVYSLSEDVIANNSRFENNACTETDCLGGAMFTFQGAAVLTDTHFITNTADGAGGALSAAAATIAGGLFQDNRCLAALCAGGALETIGPLTVNDVQFINNSADVGGAISVAGSDPARIVNTLFARNSAGTGGAALYLASSDVVDILYSTVATPTLGANAAIYVDDGTVNITNTIVASYTTGIEVGLGGPVTSDYNLFYNAPTSEITGSNSLTNVNPLFFDMAADNYRLASASPAIGAATDVGVDTDLDGTARPQLGSFDIGAFEYNACGVTNVNDDGPGSLRANLAACPEVVFDAGFFATPRTIQLLSPLPITTDVIVDGARYAVYTPTIQAGTGFRVFTVTAGVDATLNRLTITGGRLSGADAATGAGAGIFNNGNLTATNSLVTGNVVTDTLAGQGAGVYNAAGGVLVLAGTTLYSNTAAAGGGLYVSGGAVTLDHAVVSSNLVTYTNTAPGGGVYVAAGVLTVTNGSVITNNVAFTATVAGTSQGGGIYAQEITALRLISGTIGANTANQGGGLYLAAAGDLDLADVTFIDNYASPDFNALSSNGKGGGIYAAGALALTNGVLRDNEAHLSGGGLYASSYLTVTGSQFLGNVSASPFSVTPPNPDGGGGAYAVLTATITSALFQANFAANGGGGLRAPHGAVITGSDFFSNTATGYSGGAHIVGSGVLTAVVFAGNAADSSGGLYVGAGATIAASRFQENVARGTAGQGGAVSVSGPAVLTTVQFLTNTAGFGGGGVAVSTGPLQMTDTTFISNTARMKGGALYADADSIEIDNSRFERSRVWETTGNSTFGGAVYVDTTGSVTVTASVFLSNTAAMAGGALCDNDGAGSHLLLISSLFRGNSADRAGAVCVGENGSAVVTDTQFIANRATKANGGDAGALYVHGMTAVSASHFEGNTSTGQGGALMTGDLTYITDTVFVSNTAGSSGALFVHTYPDEAAGNAVIVDSWFLSNTATTGEAGAVQVDGSALISGVQFIGNTAKIRSGALSVGSTITDTLTIDASWFEANTTAGNGGAVSANDSSSVTVTATSFVSNTAASDGGALDVGHVTLVGGLFQNNRTTGSGSGGAMIVQYSASITGVTFVSNTSASAGGAIYGISGSYVAIEASQFLSNTAGSHGGAVAVIGAAVVTATDFISNSSRFGGALSGAGASSVITVTDSLFQRNSAIRGGAVAVFGRAFVGATRIFTNTGTELGGGVYVDDGTAVLSSTQIVSNTAITGAGIYGDGRVTLAAVDLQQNRCSSGSCANNGIYSLLILTVTADAPYTYTDDMELFGDLVVLGDVTFPNNVATFSTDPGVATTHMLTGTGVTSFNHLAVSRDSFLNVGSSVITATGVTTNAGVIQRLAPAQTVTNGGPARTYDDGVGKPTAVIAQPLGSPDMGDTTVRVSANLTTTEFLCNGHVISPLAARRYYVITPTNGSNVTADLTLYYYDGAANSESAGLDGADLRIFHCDGTRWKLLGQAEDYTTGTAGDYVWVKASDQAFTSFSPFAITAVPLTNTNLVNLQVFSGSVGIPLTPSFATATTDYTATVANDVVSVTVKPAITQTFATVEVNGAIVVSGSASSPIPLLVGPNVITTVVYAQDGVTTQTYTVTITRASAARLTDLELSAGPLNPAPFISTTQAYTLAPVSFATASTLVTVTPEYAGDTLAVTAALSGATAGDCTGAASPWTCPLAVGVNVITVTVTTSDATTRVYTVTVPRAGDASLSDLELSAAPINPAPFVSTTLAYTTAVLSNSVASTFVTPTLTYGSDVVSITVAANGGAAAACTAAPYDCPLAVGENVISVTVTAIDNTTQVYTVTAPRASQAQLSGLTVAPGGVSAPLYPAFGPTTQAYTMTVASYTAITASVAATAAFASDPITVVAAPAGGTEATCTGAAPWTCPLAVGQNTISVTVTAADNTTRVYTVTLTRAGDATLSNLEVSAGALDPVFISTTLAYTAPAVVKTVASTLVTATTTYASDQLSVTVGSGACAGAASPWTCPLVVGVNVVSVTVTAADNTTQVYNVTVQRLPSDNADLASLVLSHAELTPDFDSATTGYTATVPSYIARVVITPTTVDADATIAVSGSAVISGTASPTIPLIVGDNVITTVVTAENGVATKTYTVTVTLPAPVSPWYVQPDGDNTNPCTAFGPAYACATIQGAMAKAVDGDTIYIAGATYTETLNITKSLTFIGVNTPTIRALANQRVITVTAGATVTLDGLTITGGRLSCVALNPAFGAGIYNLGALTVTHSTIAENVTSGDTANCRGGGLYTTGPLWLIDSAVISNVAAFGGGINAASAQPVFLDHTLVANNAVSLTMSSSGGGIYVASGAAVTVTNGSGISGNLIGAGSTSGTGGGIYAEGAVSILSSTVSSNHLLGAGSFNRGGGIFFSGSTLQVSASTIASNTAATGAGGLFVNTGGVTLDNTVVESNVVGNSTADAGGGGIYLSAGALTVTNQSLIANNVVSSTTNAVGGGIYAQQGTLLVISSTIASNAAWSSDSGGGGLVVSSNAIAILTASSVLSNTSEEGGGIASQGTITLTGSTVAYNRLTGDNSGGGIYIAGGRLALLGSTIARNDGQTGLGGGLLLSEYAQPATILDSVFIENSAGVGGGLFARGTSALLTVSNTRFISNTASSNSSGNTAGGLIGLGPILLTGGAFEGNRTIDSNYAASNGLYADQGLTITVSAPYTYADNFNLRNDLFVTGNLTFTAGIVTFSSSGVNTHTVTSASAVAFRDLAALDDSVVFMDSPAITVTGVFTNAGIINRLAPTQTIATQNAPYAFRDGVGRVTAVLTQTGGTAMGDTVVWVSAYLPASTVTCDAAPLSTTAVRRYFIITPTVTSGVTADLALSYFDDSGANSEANGTIPPDLAIFRCNNGVWESPNAPYTFASDGLYNTVQFAGYTFDGFGIFAIGAAPARNANLVDLVVRTATYMPTLTPLFDPATLFYSTTVGSAVPTVTVQPTITGTFASVQVNGVTVVSGTASAPISVVVGLNVITTVVTAQDGVTTQTYTVTVERLPNCMATPDDGATRFQSIDGGAVQQAVDAASVGATVKIAGACAGVQARGGTTQTVAITLPLTLRGGYTFTNWLDSYPITQPTTLDATDIISNRRVISATAAITVADLTVQNGDVSSEGTCIADYRGCGGGIFGADVVALSNVTVLTNTAASGGGLYAAGAATVVGGVFRSNVSDGSGGGLYASVGLLVTDTEFNGNRAGDGGGVFLNATATLTNARFISNTAQSTGGGLYAGVSQSINLAGGLFISNTATSHGGAVYNIGVLSVTGGVFTANASGSFGGGIYAGTIVVSATQFVGNMANYGGGLSAFAALDVSHSRFVANVANSAGGAINHAGIRAARVANSLFARNRSGTNGAALYLASSGGVIVLNSTVVSPTIGAGAAIHVNGGAVNITNTLVASYTVGIANAGGTITSDYNLFYNAPTAIVTGSNSITGVNPLFRDVTADNYRVRGGSPAIDRGQDLAAQGIVDDLDRVTRPQLLAYDIGAYEADPCGPVLVENTNDSGTGSLRQTILDADACATVVFDPAVFATPQTIQLTSGEIVLDKQLTIDGAANGVYTPTIQGPGPGATTFRIFNVAASTPITLNQLIIAGGNVSGTTAATGAGAGIFSAGNLVVSNSVITNNTAAGSTSGGLGGGLYINSGTLQLIDSTLSANRATRFGGGLYIAAGASHVITHSTIVANTANQGAGLATRATTPIAPLAIYNMTIYSNTAVSGNGAGVYADPPLTIVGGAIYSNTGNGNGAGVYAGAGLTMTNVTVAGNANASSSYGAGVFVYSGAATITGSRFENNRCTGACNGVGLYTYNADALLTLEDTQFISNVATNLGGGLYAKGPVALTGGEFRGNRANSSPAGGGLFAEKVVTITASAPYTYVDGFDLFGDLIVSGNLTFTAGAVNFVIDQFNNPDVVVTHTLTSPASTAFNDLAVVNNAVLNVVSPDVRVTRVFTNAGVINRLTPTQTIALNTPATFLDGVGRPTVVITQTSGAAMGATSVWVSAHLSSTAITCGAAPLSTTAVRRYFIITPTVSSGVTADLALSYFAGAANSEANNTNPPALAIFRCNNGTWESPDAPYSFATDGLYRTVQMTGQSFDGFGVFAIGAAPSRNAALTNLVLQGAAVTPTLTPAFTAAVFEYTTTVASDVLTLTATPTLSDTTASVRVNGAPVTSGTPSAPINLAFGTTVITTVVTAQDGLTTQTYTATVTRPPTCAATPDNGLTEFWSLDGSAVQQAVDAASAGATVKVAGDCRGVQAREGENQTLYISQTLTVEGGYIYTDWRASYPITQPTTLDAQAGGRVIFATAPITVADLTLQHGAIGGSDTVCPGAGCGGGLYAGAALQLSNVQVLSNTATHGGGVHSNAAITVIGGRFENNTATGDGGGLRAAGASVVTGTTFVSNTAVTAGGALLEADARVADTSFVRNSTVVTGSAGGGYFNGIATLTNVTFTLNTAGSAGGGGAVFATAATVIGGEFVSNTAAFAGGGAYFNDAASLTDTRIANNTATANRGGGAYFNGTATLSNTVFAGNVASNDRGGGAYFRGDAELDSTSFEGNAASNRAGGAYFFAGATLTDTNFISNTGTVRAGGAYVGGVAVVSGGLFQGNQCTTACLGSGLFVSDTLTMTDAHFIGNSTDGSGGGLLTMSNADIAQTTFTGNSAGAGGGGWVQAGGTNTRISNSLFAANSAGNGAGDAIAVMLADNNGIMSVLYTTIASPTVSTGAGVYVSAGMMEITNTIVASHTASILNVGGVVTSDYNLFFAAPTAVITGSHSIEGRDPRFVDPAAGDYHLSAGSAAIDTAVDEGVTTDLDGALRPQGDGYDIGAYESPLSSNPDLASLTPSQGSLTPPFASATTRYTVTVVYGASSVTLTPTTVDPNATIVVSGAPVLSGSASAPIPLIVGENVITTTVTAQNGVKTKDYVVVVIRASLAALSGLEINPGALTPAFISTTLAYTAQVTNATPGILITPTGSAGDVITVTVSQNGGAPIPCSGAETACPLVVGENVISVTVTAADGTTQTYTITVTRPSEAWLLGLEINPGTLTPGFISTTLAYTAAVGNPVASTHVTVTASPGDVISVTVTPGGGAVVACTGAPLACPLAVGENVITVTVTAADNAARTYTVTATRAPATDAALIALEISSGTLTPAFDSATTAYAATVAHLVASLIVTPTTSEPNATITVNGAPVASATGTAPIPLNVGANPITTTVIAQDGVTRRDYILIVTRPAVAVMAVNDAAGMVQGGAIVIAPLANDPDPVGGGLAVTSVGQPGHGAVAIDAAAQTVTYTPDPAYSGVDFFTYVARDINGSTDEGVVTVIVAAQSQTNDAPQIGIVDNQNGATLDFADHGFQVSVQLPAGSYTGTMGPKDIFYLVYTIIMTPTGDVNQAPNGLRFGNIVFDLSAFFNYDLLPGYRFPTPITLELTYDPAMLGGLSEPTLELFYWDGAAWSSEGITFLARDTQNHTITIALAHLSELAVFGSAPTALEPTPEPGLVVPRLYLPVVTHAVGAVAEQAAPVDVPLTPEDAPLAAPLEPEATPPAAGDAPAEESVPDMPETLTTPETPLPVQVLLPIIIR